MLYSLGSKNIIIIVEMSVIWLLFSGASGCCFTQPLHSLNTR